MHNRRILIVDDNKDIHDDFRKILTLKKAPQDEALSNLEDQLFGTTTTIQDPALNWSFEIDSAYQGQDALKKIEEAAANNRPYALVFMDVRMPPGWDGIETTKKIWEKFPNTEIVLCTAYSDYSMDEMISHLGVSHRLLFIKKPFDAVAIKQMALAVTTKWNFEEISRSHVEDLASAVQKRTKELEESLHQLRNTQGQLLQAGKMSALGEMAGGIAHEINTPLATITLLTEQLQNTLSQGSFDLDDIEKNLKIIAQTTARIAKIIKGLKSFSRDGDQDPFRRVSLKKIIDETLSLCQERMKNHNITLKIEEIPESLNLDCRETQISQVLLNLLNNAYDAVESQSEKWVAIRFTEDDRNIEIHISDSGPGIPENVRAKLFQPFFTTKEIGKGTGLGLSISKGILDSHHGHFSLGLGENTEFIVHLPKFQKAS